MMREKSESKSFLHHNFAAEGVALVFEGGGERRAEVYGDNFVSSCSRIMFICISIFVTCSIKFEIFRHKVKCNKHCFSRSLLCFWDSHNIKKNDEFMGISLLLLDEQQQLDLPSVSSLTPLWCCSGGLSRNFTRSLPTPVNRTFLPMKTEEADFLCKAQIVGVVQQNGLSFVSCTGCNRKLAKSLWCNRCVSPNAPGSSAVDDGKESATFVVFEREMIKLIKKEAKSGSCVDTLVAVGGMELPKCLEELAINGYLFSYSGNSNKAPVVDLKSGQPTAFSSSAGDAAKIALGNDGANQSGSADCC
ncbi:unnamed protein product [Brassica oleracea]